MSYFDFISPIASLIIAWVTSKLTYRHENKKFILEKREILYCELIELLDKLINEPNLMFEDRFKEALLANKPKMKLLASSAVLEDFILMFEFIAKQHTLYVQFCRQNDPFITMVECVTNDDGEDEEISYFSQTDIELFEFRAGKKKKEIVDDCKAELRDNLNMLVDSMRTDICSQNSWWRR